MVFLQPSCRTGLTTTDLAFLAEALGAEPASLESLWGDPGVRDRLLDEPRIRLALFDRADPTPVSMELFFYLLVRQCLLEEGIDDRDLADYIATVLAGFGPELTQSARSEYAAPQLYLSTVLEAIGQSRGVERFFLLTYVGNHILFLTGVFPEHLEHRERRRGAPSLSFYEDVGSAQYRVASQDDLAARYEMRPIYTRLANSFRTIRVSLNRVREQWLHLGGGIQPGLS